MKKWIVIVLFVSIGYIYGEDIGQTYIFKEKDFFVEIYSNQLTMNPGDTLDIKMKIKNKSRKTIYLFKDETLYKSFSYSTRALSLRYGANFYSSLESPITLGKLEKRHEKIIELSIPYEEIIANYNNTFFYISIDLGLILNDEIIQTNQHLGTIDLVDDKSTITLSSIVLDMLLSRYSFGGLLVYIDKN